MFFEYEDSKPIPLPPVDPGQATRIADDETIFDLKGIQRRSGWTEQSLAMLYELAWPEAAVPAAEVVITEQEALKQALAGWQLDPDKVLIRHHEFGKLSDEDLGLFLAKCRQRHVNPWSGQAIPEFRWNRFKDRLEVVIILTIGAKRGLAMATGEYVGLCRPNFEYIEDRRPDRCWIVVKRRVGAQVCEFIGEAAWRDFYPGNGVDSLWDSKPEVCLKTVALSDALTNAFPELSEIYTAPEFSKGRREGPHGGGPTPSAGDGASPVGSAIAGVIPIAAPAEAAVPAAVTAETAPHNLMGFHRALIDLKLETLTARDAVIKEFERQFPGLWDADEQGFYARVLEAVRRAPRRWGAAVG